MEFLLVKKKGKKSTKVYHIKNLKKKKTFKIYINLNTIHTRSVELKNWKIAHLSSTNITCNLYIKK